MSTAQSLTEGKPFPVLFRFALPVIGGNLFQLFYTLADTVIVGRTLGAEALAFRAQAQQVLEQLPPAVWETARQLAAQPWDWQPLAERFTARAAGEGLAQSIVTLGEALDWEEPDCQPPATREDQQAARQLVEEALAQPENWEQALVERVNACKKRHPVWARLATGLVTLLLGKLEKKLAYFQ